MTEPLHFHFSLLCIGEGNGNPLSVLAQRIPGTGEPGGLPSMGSQSRIRLKRLSSNTRLPQCSDGKESACQCTRFKRQGFDLWVGKILWRKKWQPTPVFWSGKAHGQRSLVGQSTLSHKRVGRKLATKQQQQSIAYLCKSQSPNSSHPPLSSLTSIHLFCTCGKKQ